MSYASTYRRSGPDSWKNHFWDKVDREGPVHPTLNTNCWVWIASRNKKGYGHLRARGTIAYAHRLAWELKRGPIPEGLWVLHRCDNPWCVRPDHLFLGTHKDNVADCTAKKRWRGGRKKKSGHLAVPTSPGVTRRARAS